MTNASSDVLNYFKINHLLGRSYIKLRQLFKTRYTLFHNGAIWDDTPACGANYKYNKSSLTKPEQTSIANGNSEEWDSTTLTHLLLKGERPNTLNPTEIQQLDDEDKLVEGLKDIRNKLAHLPSKSVADAEFHQLWADTSRILLALGDEETELDKMKDDKVFETNSQPINEQNVKEAQKLYSSGMEACKENKFNEAITCFINATVKPGVPDHDRAKFYAELSSSRLALYEQQTKAGPFIAFELFDAQDHRYRALQDAKQARNLWSTWWRGHFCVGKVYESLHEYESAIRSFERALALYPTNDKIKEALDNTRSLYGHQLHPEYSDPKMAQGTIPKLAVNPKLLQTNLDELDEKYPPGANVRRGHQYAFGNDGIRQDYEQAAKYYAKALNQGNAEGMYNLAYLTDYGLGVKKDHDLAHKLYLQAAEQRSDDPFFQNSRNVGVAEAELALGFHYATGTAVEQDYSAAACWYHRAVKHGSAEAARSLAILYQNGTGVTQNMETAEKLFKLATEKDDPNGTSCESDNITEKIKNRPSSNTFKPVYKLSGDSRVHYFDELYEYAQRGWKTAQTMHSALEHFFLSISLIIDTESLTEDQENEFVHELSQCYRLARIVAQFPDAQMRQKTIDIVNQVHQRCNIQFKNSTSELDEDVRICHAVLHMNSREMINQFLKQCMQKYRRSILFFELTTVLNNLLKKYDESLYAADGGLIIDPNYCELLYHKAVALRLLGKDLHEAIKCYKAFLTIAPEDHRKVPQSYYAIGLCYHACQKSEDTSEIIRTMYEQGEEAEKKQLPCFLPYESESKTALKDILDQISSVKTQSSPLSNPQRTEIIVKHRERENRILHKKRNLQSHQTSNNRESRVKKQKLKKLVGLKSISIKEMNSTNDRVYEGYVLVVKIIENTHSCISPIHLVVEDEHYDCMEMHIDDFPEEKVKDLVSKVYTIGSKMHIINPYLQLDVNDMKPFICIDDFSSIIMQHESERVPNMCRCCGKPNAQNKCSKCQNAYYCSTECQIIDWNIYQHKLICRNSSSN